ncbi:MAG: zinc-binding dehydrogenase, partial [Chloroflexota bacterium]
RPQGHVTMWQAVVEGERRAALKQVPDPQPKDNWVVVKVHAAPMCTEYKLWQSGRPTEYLGHEAAGVVVAVAQPGRVQVGDRVVVMPLYACGQCALCVAGDYIHCQSGADPQSFLGTRVGTATYAQYLVKPDWLLPKIPDGVSYELASLACCGLGPSCGAFDLMGVDALDTVLITGAGPVGLGAVVNAKYRGARAIVVESLPYRVDYARRLGAGAVLDPRDSGSLGAIRDLTGGRGVDKALDCSGTVAAQRLCIEATRRKGQVTFVGECNDPLSIRISPDMIRTGLTLRGSWHYNLSLYPEIMQVIQRSPVVAQLISHVLPMSRVQEAFELSASQQNAKIILHPWE